MILVINTSGENAYLGIYDQKLLAETSWNVGRTLSADLLDKLSNLLIEASVEIEQLDGIIACAGPGSFTGLRIGISTANTIAYSLNIPIIGVTGDKSLEELFLEGNKLFEKEDKHFSSSLEPFYGAPPSVTISKNKP